MAASGADNPLGNLHLTSEVASLRDKYGRSCRVLFGVGEVACMVDVKVANGQLTFKFQISGVYRTDEYCL